MGGPGKGFGGGEATRDPEPTKIDPNDPKGKQQAIHKAESFADYLKRRQGNPTMKATAGEETPHIADAEIRDSLGPLGSIGARGSSDDDGDGRRRPQARGSSYDAGVGATRRGGA